MTISENEINLIQSKIKSNRAVKETTMIKNLGDELYNKLKNEGILESKSEKVKFKPEFWSAKIKTKKTAKPRKPTPKNSASKPLFKEDTGNLENPVIKIINEKIEPLVNLISSLDKRISTLEGSNIISINKTPVISPGRFKELLKAKYDLINFNERRGGMVPIPKIWDEIVKEGVSRNQFEKELFNLELARIIELQIASDPSVVIDSHKSIKHPSRGLINYVIWRK